MKEFKGTKGKWTVEGDEFYDEHHNNIFDIVCYSDTTCDEDDSNALLIAAAPEMLEVLTVTMEDIGFWMGQQTPELKNRIEDAIKKALGEG